MKIKANIEISDNSTIKDLESIGITPKFLQFGYEEFFKNVLNEQIDSTLVDYTLFVTVEE